MLGTETTYRHRLQAPCPTIVAQGDTSHTMQGVSHIRHTQTQHLLTVEDAEGRRTPYLMLTTTLCHRHLTKLMSPVRNGIIANSLPLSDIRHQAGYQ